MLAVERLTRAGVKAGVALAPIIPGLTDGESSLAEVARAAASAGARFLWANTLNLKPGTKEHFLWFLRQEYPELYAGLRDLYPRAYAPGLVESWLQRRVADVKRAHGLMEPRLLRSDTAGPRQLKLAIV